LERAPKKSVQTRKQREIPNEPGKEARIAAGRIPAIKREGKKIHRISRVSGIHSTIRVGIAASTAQTTSTEEVESVGSEDWAWRNKANPDGGRAEETANSPAKRISEATGQGRKLHVPSERLCRVGFLEFFSRWSFIMERIGFKMKIKPEFREAYLKLHQNVDRPLIEEYRKLGVRKYSIYLAEDGTLFAFLECDDWAAFTQAVEGSPNQKTWGEKVYSFFDIKPDEAEGMVLLTEAFYMDQEKP
jgi:L-rhamnose mutarotase